jgi:hypothetical protein
MPGTAELHPIGGCMPSRVADVIFIHGPDGDPFDTWKHATLFWQQMLRHALQYGDPAWQRIGRATAGIVFLATPNSGSRIANWMTFFFARAHRRDQGSRTQ